jgi:hypothetical protein
MTCSRPYFNPTLSLAQVFMVLMAFLVLFLVFIA